MNTNDDKTIPAHSVPPVSSGMYEQGDQLLRTGMMQPPQTPGVLGMIGKYPVVRILGEGGMGQVLLAREPVTDSLVAIKLIKPEFLNKGWAVHRFLTEARHMFRMSHAAIIRVLDVSDRAEGPYFVMPFMSGGSLADKIKPGEPLPPETILPIARSVAEALHHAHTHGITHRDLKPSNVLLDAEGKAHLADFGLLRTFLNDTLVDAGQPQMEGTVPYMSPAVAAGKAEDTRCDIYAFGCLLYEMLTGQPPYQGPTVDAVLKQIQTGPPSPIRQFNPHAPANLVAIADHAMARELRDRYATMADVVNDLDRAANGKEPIEPHGREKGSPNRRRALIAAGVVALVGLAAFGISRLDWKHGDQQQVIASPVPPQKYLTVDLGGGVTMDFVLIRSGSFTMGSDTAAHKVTLTKPYYLGKYEVTQEQWEKLMGSNPSTFKGAKNPVENVSWTDCQTFLAKLKEKVPGQTFRLPTEAEWEFACRAGNTGEYCYGDGEGSLVEYAWYESNANNTTHTVGEKKPNAWGLYDMHGNVWEWCADWFGDYPSGSPTDPTGPETASDRVFRGGCWRDRDTYCRSAHRVNYSFMPDTRRSFLGFRVAAVLAGGAPSGAGVPASGPNPPPVVSALPKTGSPVPVAGVPALNANPPAPLTEGPFTYTVTDDSVTIVKYTGTDGVVAIPGKIAKLTVTGIGDRAFAYCGMTNVTVPNSVTRIGSEAFSGCGNLTRITIPAGVTAMGATPFAGCSELVSIIVDDANPVYSSSADGVLFDKKKTCLITYPGGKAGKYVIPESITKISQSAFGNCTKLTGVTIPDSVNDIGANAFINCTKLTGVTIPNGVTSIEFRAFNYCINLTSVTMADNVTSLVDEAFAGCTKLTSIKIPASVTAMGPNTFAGCSELISIMVDNANPAFSSSDDGVLFDKKKTSLLMYPGGKTGNYVIPGGITKISTSAFGNCTNLTGVTIPESVTNIEPNAFGGCDKLTAIEVTAANPVYSSSADGVLFNKDKSKLVRYPTGKAGSYVIPDGVTSIEGRAFSLCTNLTDVTIPDSVAMICDDGVFWKCFGLARVVIGEGIRSIGKNAFEQCYNLTSVLFRGDAPKGDADLSMFSYTDKNKATVYYLPTTKGWGKEFGGRPTAVWEEKAK